ncbi:PQQ-dependent sugar dehydrogenase [Halovivax gelatinilyticus]|uniref:PQQ-dependent sugar dehydrogenase n=1 Tax=Halovivax gelatinilyticus TaxID=2961597 RepID=UPI0020CA95E5|nr:PQQ-dependent sugar dehydrogenase [Halovivax gelatinilyticus]
MNRRTLLVAAGGALSTAVAGCTSRFQDDDPFDVEELTDAVSHPWGLAFVPETERLLVTELDGRLVLVDREDGAVEPVDGTPAVHAAGQGGLLDVALSPDFGDDPWVYLTYAAANDDGQSATHVGRGRLEFGGEAELAEFEALFVVEPFVDSTAHYGSRVGFGPDGALYVTTGDRGSKEFGPDHVSQDAENAIGATLRLEPDGSIPEDNPFVDEPNVADAIYSYGHRNVQGMAVHPETDEIWLSEHGEEDGDALHVLEAGENYGWPIAHTGCEYGTETPVGDDPHERDDVVDPVYAWACTSGGFPPAGMTFYDDEAFPDWRGDLFVGNLAGEYLGRFAVDGTDVEEADPLLSDRGWRVRDVAVAPDTGYLYVLVDGADGPVVRLSPE